MSDKRQKSDAQWREAMTPEQYQVCRQQGTEPAFSGMYWDTKTLGVYVCSACGAPLFSSQTKFDSGTGWPSFYQPIQSQVIEETTDNRHGMVRTEVHCRQCNSHLGHVFPDGPAPTGLRYCINSLSLRLKSEAP